MKTTRASNNQNKQRGEWAEMRFMARASEQGLLVSKPWGESCRYDFAVEHDGKFLRVQVKSTICRKKTSYNYHFSGRPYTREQIDFVAVYIVPKNVWFIFPIDVILKNTSNVILSPHLTVSKHGAYKEAWHLLRGEGRPAHPAKLGSIRTKFY